MTFYCIADEDTVRGFRLAGVDGEVVEAADTAIVAFERACGRPDCGVVIVSREVAESIRPYLRSLRSERDQPLMVEIPGVHSRPPNEDAWGQLVRAAVGIRLGGVESP